jgi:hypothetical protein
VAEPVTLAYVHGHEVAYAWHKSYMDLIAYDLQHNHRVVTGGTLAVKYPTGGIVQARNQVVERFLETDTPWLFWIDTDMGFAADTVDRLVDSADPAERPIVGGLCFAQRELEPDGLGGWTVEPVPTLYDWFERPDGIAGFAARYRYEKDTVQRVSATGSACVLIHRSVFETVAAQYGPCWYDQIRNPSDGRWLGEDMSFCIRAGERDLSVWVDTSVKTNHFKNCWVSEVTSGNR